MLRLERLEPRCTPARLAAYTLVDFGVDTVGSAVNNAGLAAGGYGRDYPFLVLPDGSHVPINTPGPADLYHLTDSGILTGTVNHSDGTTSAAYWDRGGRQFHNLGTLGGPLGEARGANESGVIVGSAWADAFGGPRAWVYRGAGLEVLDPLPGDTFAAAYAVNDAGVIVGISGRHNVRWNPDGSIDALDLPGRSAFPLAVNDAGLIAGFSADGSASIAWVYQGGTATVLPGLGTDFALVEGMSGSGLIAGYAAVAPGVYHAVVWAGGRITDLDLGPWVPAGWTLRAANGVNDRGQIVGTAVDAVGREHGFLLNPAFAAAPPPATWALAWPWHRRGPGPIGPEPYPD